MKKILLLLMLTGCAQELNIEAYFCPQDGCMDVFIQNIEGSSEVKCAFYDLELPELIAALKLKNASLVIDYASYSQNKGLLEDLDIIVGWKYIQMHNKFCVLDDGVITGSFNPTERGNEKNNNNVLVIRNEKIRKAYLAEFEEMRSGVFAGGSKGKQSACGNGSCVSVYFCPEDCEPEIIADVIDDAQQSVYFMTFSFTDMQIAEALVKAHERGLDIAGVMESSQAGSYSVYDYLMENKINILKDKNPYNMHHKVFIIDDIVVTGSTNPTGNGFGNNDENLVVVRDYGVYMRYLEEFENVYG